MDITVQSLWNHREDSKPQLKNGELLSNTKVGLEVEIENMYNPAHVPGWRLTGDGSLRNNGVEYVFSGPIGGSAACKRIDSLHKYLETVPDKRFSERTSLHVHVDVRDLSWDQVISLVILYAMVEPYLFSICGQEREEGIYSLSLYRGKNQIDNLFDLIHSGPSGVNERHFSKYAALNLLSLRSFGSLEFRGHKGSGDKSEIINWINHLLSLKMFVLDPSKSLHDLPKILSTDGHIAMLRYVFSDKLIVKNIKSANRVRKKIYDGVCIGEDLLFTTRFREAHSEIYQNYQGQTQLEKLKDNLCVD